ncbi:4Fe-4S dicluster domain-containing protein [Bacteroidota bacterium]
MSSRVLKIIRVILALLFFIFTTLIFLDFSNSIPTKSIGNITFLQFIPSLMKFLQGFSILVAGFIVVILLTLILGRLYCSTICPLGVFQDIIIYIKRRLTRKKRFRYIKPNKLSRYSILIASTGLWLFVSSFFIILLDPYSLFGRISTTLFRPVLLTLNNLLSKFLGLFEIYSVYPVDIKSSSIGAIVFSLLALFIIIYLSLRLARIYCNLICPVGTFLGLISKISFFKIRMNESLCNSCGACSAKCKAGCIDSFNKKVDHSRCIVCFNCLDSCSQNGIAFSHKKQSEVILKSIESSFDSSKRSSLKIGGLIAIGALSESFSMAQEKVAIVDKNKKYKALIPVIREHPVTPPGSIGLENFNSNCTSCYLCVSACPTQVLQPSFLKYGLNGFMQPYMDYITSFCNFDCTVCGEVCPTKAIKPLPLEEKQLVQMGIAEFIEDNCIVKTENTDCGACSEHCPTKAVNMKPYEGTLTIPYVTDEICIGCGACEFACPTEPKAIYVKTNVIHEIAEKPKSEGEIEVEATDDFPF